MIQSTTAAKQLESITSEKNPLLREVRKALARGTATTAGYCVAESFHLLEEALRSECPIQCVLAADSVASAVEAHVRGLHQVRVVVLPDPLFHSLAATETSQGVMALVKTPDWKLDQLFRGRSLVVVLDGLQDPGNAGTIVRAAEAFGASGVIFVKGTVSPFNAKTLRASAGSLFRLPFLAGVEADIARAAMEQKKLEIYAAMPRALRPLGDLNLTRRFALVVGGEGRGVSDKLQSRATGVRIPTTGVESLNAALAAGVFLYEASRQRMAKA